MGRSPIRVYPRACGGTTIADLTIRVRMGLSPRVRGNRLSKGAGTPSQGSIPARAGEPQSIVGSRWNHRVYPRACGGTIITLPGYANAIGLSPRVRGNRWSWRHSPADGGSIPARAGEPAKSTAKSLGAKVYPRACGGTGSGVGLASGSGGLSPRVRGNRGPRHHWPDESGSIPARAGEPRSTCADTSRHRVYPRACGGTGLGAVDLAVLQGLSPRVRGNPVRHDYARIVAGSIPARAGEPVTGSVACALRGVYPRACGGTTDTIDIAVIRQGLSPRCAGEPPTQSTSPSSGRVYPRACGGTRWRMTRSRRPRGLSPARAGEPASPRAPVAQGAVYPRACGGTSMHWECSGYRSGLSPRVRGNLTQISGKVDARRSIPARAGEPQPG